MAQDYTEAFKNDKEKCLKSIEKRHEDLKDVLYDHEIIMEYQETRFKTTQRKIDEALVEINKMLDEL